MHRKPIMPDSQENIDKSPPNLSHEVLDSLSHYKIGSVPFLNAAPLTLGIEHITHFLPPNRLANELATGNLDVALLSITELFRNPGFKLLSNFGICSNGPVFSVFLAHKQPIHEIKTIYLDTASCTSVKLLEFILNHHGITPELVPLNQSYQSAQSLDNILLIGNPAIEFRLKDADHAILDLGAEWSKITKLSFVYAGWIARANTPEFPLSNLLNAVASHGLENLNHIHQSHPDFSTSFRLSYVGNAIKYHITDQEINGIHHFAHFLKSSNPDSFANSPDLTCEISLQ